MTSATEVQQWGMKEMRRINDLIQGKCGIYDEAAGLWAWCVWNAGNLDVLDIGTAFGASAILAARVKQQYGLNGAVYSVDNWTGEGEWQSSAELAAENIAKCGVSIWLPKKMTAQELYASHQDIWFASVLIDADHHGKFPLHDWNIASLRAHWVMFHDTDLTAVREAIAVAKEDHNFVLAAERNNCAVFRRIYG